jgi:serine/threonine protein phosphatase PrpC
VSEKQSSAGINYRAFFYCLFDGLAGTFLGEEVEFVAAEAANIAL